MKPPKTRMISALFGLILLLHPLVLLSGWQPEPGHPPLAAGGSHPARTAAALPLFLPLIATPLGPPDFEITNPGEGWTVSGVLFVAAQARDPRTVSSVTFRAGSTTLGTDSTVADGFRTFLDTRSFPAGSLTLTAVASGPGGQTSKSLAVSVQPDPPSSATLGPQGGVLGSEIGSLITIPPAALSEATQLSVDELSQEEVQVQNGIDWEAIGVTFLGAQTIQSSAPLASPYRVASAGFANRVQPGQAVVNYQLVPDADGDGVDEIVVVNTASVAPGSYVISDPIPQLLVEETALTGSGLPAGRAPATTGGPPGTAIDFPANGFNPLSFRGNVAEWTCSDGTKLTVSGSVRPNPATPQGQIFSTVIPLCSPGPALVLLKNLSTSSSAGPFVVMVTTPPPLASVPGTVTLQAIRQSQGSVDAIPQPLLPSAHRQALQDALDAAEQDTQARMADPTPQNQAALEDSDTLLSELEADFPPPGAGDDCLTREAKEAIDGQAGRYYALANEWYLKHEVGVGDYYLRIAGYLDVLTQLPTCEEEEPPCTPSPTAVVVGTTGMGSGVPPGGNGCGNVVGAGGGSGGRVRAAQVEGPVVIKIFATGLPTPFSGVADPGGFFFVPMIPAGAPFAAVAYDTASGESRTVEGVGPNIGEQAVLFFDFYSEDTPSATVTWDGGGDGRSWHDPYNWNPDAVPGPNEDVVIDVPGEVTVDHWAGSHAIRSLHSEEPFVLSGGTLVVSGASSLNNTFTMSGGTLNTGGELVLNELFVWQQGTMSGPGVTAANGGIHFDGPGGRMLTGLTLANANMATFQNGSLSLTAGATFTNTVGATLDFLGDTLNTIISDMGNGSAFHNLGTVVKSPGSGTVTIGAPFHNSGTVDVQAGTLTLTGFSGGSHSGTFQGGGTLEIACCISHTLTGHIGTGGVLLTTGTLFMNGTYDVGSTTLTGISSLNPGLVIGSGRTANSGTFTQSGHSLSGPGTLHVSGHLTWTQGTMSGSGTTIATGGIIFSGNTGRILNGRTLENHGTAVFEDGYLNADNSATIANLEGATFDFQGDDSLGDNLGTSTFNNLGTVTKSGGTGTATINLQFINGGSVDVQSGQLRFVRNFTQTAAGTLSVQIGGLTPITDYDQYAVGGNATLDGTLDVTLSGGYVPMPGDSFAIFTFDTHSGQFATVNGHGQGYGVTYNTRNVTLVAQ